MHVNQAAPSAPQAAVAPRGHAHARAAVAFSAELAARLNRLSLGARLRPAGAAAADAPLPFLTARPAALAPAARRAHGAAADPDRPAIGAPYRPEQPMQPLSERHAAASGCALAAFDGSTPGGLAGRPHLESGIDLRATLVWQPPGARAQALRPSSSQAQRGGWDMHSQQVQDRARAEAPKDAASSLPSAVCSAADVFGPLTEAERARQLTAPQPSLECLAQLDISDALAEVERAHHDAAPEQSLEAAAQPQGTSLLAEAERARHEAAPEQSLWPSVVQPLADAEGPRQILEAAAHPEASDLPTAEERAPDHVVEAAAQPQGMHTLTGTAGSACAGPGWGFGSGSDVCPAPAPQAGAAPAVVLDAAGNPQAAVGGVEGGADDSAAAAVPLPHVMPAGAEAACGGPAGGRAVALAPVGDPHSAALAPESHAGVAAQASVEEPSLCLHAEPASSPSTRPRHGPSRVPWGSPWVHEPAAGSSAPARSPGPSRATGGPPLVSHTLPQGSGTSSEGCGERAGLEPCESPASVGSCSAVQGAPERLAAAPPSAGSSHARVRALSRTRICTCT